MPERLLTLRELNWAGECRQILLDREALSGSEDLRDLVLRYLGVFPAGVRVFQRGRRDPDEGDSRGAKAGAARVLRRERQGAPRPLRVGASPVDALAPVRFMPDYATLTSRAGRRREISNEHRKKLFLSAARIRRTFS